MMTDASLLPCDGCGQLADASHFARRLARLEWATRFRPVHIQTLLLGAFSPENTSHFLYSPEGPFEGEAGQLLKALGVPTEGRARDAVLAEVQKRGLFVIHVLDCPPERGADVAALLKRQLPAAAARVRRSLKPKRVALFSAELGDAAEALRRAELGCVVETQTLG